MAPAKPAKSVPLQDGANLDMMTQSMFLTFTQILGLSGPLNAKFNNVFTIFFLDIGQTRLGALGMAWLLL